MATPSTQCDWKVVEDGDPKHSMCCYATNDFFIENDIERVLDNTPCGDVKTPDKKPKAYQATRPTTAAST
jgi:hypothetical protein